MNNKFIITVAGMVVLAAILGFKLFTSKEAANQTVLNPQENMRSGTSPIPRILRKIILGNGEAKRNSKMPSL